MCNSGVGLTPVVNGKLHHFSAGGLYNGLILLIDDETRSYWDHISGQGLHGELAGQQMEMWGIEQHAVGTLREREPQLRLLMARSTWWTRLMVWLTGLWQGKLPPGFRMTMDHTDDRLAEMAMGLGITEGEGVFIPFDAIVAASAAPAPTAQSPSTPIVEPAITLPWQNRDLKVFLDSESGIPRAEYADGSQPPQLFSRWYGYVRAYPRCIIRK